MTIVELTVTILDMTASRPARAVYRTDTCLLEINGALYPKEVELLNALLSVLRERKDSFPLKRSSHSGAEG